MSILFSNHPDGVTEIIASTLKNISAAGWTDTSPGLDLSDVSTSMPIDAFHVDGDVFAKTKSLTEAAQKVGWRYLLLSGGAVVADIHLNLKDDKLNFVSMTLDGPTLASTIQALHAAESDARVQQQEFQLRELNLAWCDFKALWLHNQSQDFIIPIDPTFGHGLTNHQLYDLNEVTQSLLRHADFT
ncbi:hypothetical protein [Xenorhabdus miraniensis]|uniref:Uncharacterized protein n=1 Tax=Xenorhabdus miraniensis TaxID=351674 RepID=A0A2D0JSA9_9GAMM|nr:hypothetical protein [Xenorhabdus miraniensis]PHM49184.1 hypothetical protein Xmir_01540 [Xenorhabdus miraniensis]